MAKRRRGLLFPIYLNRYETMFPMSVQACGLEHLKLTPHCARHGAAPIAYSTGAMLLRDIQKRGRWKAAASVRSYEKSARLICQLNRMSLSQRTRANALSSILPSLLISQV